VITVGGTNGKGSCVALLEALLRAGGHRVGTFTSPHLLDYRERIRIDGQWVSEASLVAAFERIADALGGDSLTFFEYNTLAALLVFETAAPDVIVLEVGLGGRLDAVNVVDADVAVVVSVGLDHTDWLGPDVESIGREKAGIFRPGRPAICGMTVPPRSILAVADAQAARLLLRGRDFSGDEHADGSWDFEDARGNAATALAAVRELSARVPLSRMAVERGLGEVRLAGRFQRIGGTGGVEWVLDVAHNADAAAVLADSLARTPVRGRTIAVCGMLADKDVRAVVAALRDRVDQWIAATTDGPRGLQDGELATRAAEVGVTMARGGSVPQAMRLAAAGASAGDRIVVFGSFHTVGPALSCV
jgi:dihydrofolate synthase/folylpolyglutamate synthase